MGYPKLIELIDHSRQPHKLDKQGTFETIVYLLSDYSCGIELAKIYSHLPYRKNRGTLCFRQPP